VDQVEEDVLQFEATEGQCSGPNRRAKLSAATTPAKPPPNTRIFAILDSLKLRSSENQTISTEQWARAATPNDTLPIRNLSSRPIPTVVSDQNLHSISFFRHLFFHFDEHPAPRSSNLRAAGSHCHLPRKAEQNRLRWVFSRNLAPRIGEYCAELN
jgi:hypothetical protein